MLIGKKVRVRASLSYDEGCDTPKTCTVEFVFSLLLKERTLAYIHSLVFQLLFTVTKNVMVLFSADSALPYVQLQNITQMFDVHMYL